MQGELECWPRNLIGHIKACAQLQIPLKKQDPSRVLQLGIHLTAPEGTENIFIGLSGI